MVIIFDRVKFVIYLSIDNYLQYTIYNRIMEYIIESCTIYNRIMEFRANSNRSIFRLENLKNAKRSSLEFASRYCFIPSDDRHSLKPGALLIHEIPRG